MIGQKVEYEWTDNPPHWKKYIGVILDKILSRTSTGSSHGGMSNETKYLVERKDGIVQIINPKDINRIIPPRITDSGPQ